MRGITGLLFYSVAALAPILAGVFIASRFLLRRDRLIGLAPLAVVIGFLAGGVVGWGFVPAQWTASFWTTVEAAGNAAKYGASFEHMAEHALLYFFYSALLGAIAFGVAALVVVWRVPGPAFVRGPFRRI
jgi:MFS superfamily sulfate permease-like transporter